MISNNKKTRFVMGNEIEYGKLMENRKIYVSFI